MQDLNTGMQFFSAFQSHPLEHLMQHITFSLLINISSHSAQLELSNSNQQIKTTFTCNIAIKD